VRRCGVPGGGFITTFLDLEFFESIANKPLTHDGEVVATIESQQFDVLDQSVRYNRVEGGFEQWDVVAVDAIDCYTDRDAAFIDSNGLLVAEFGSVNRALPVLSPSQRARRVVSDTLHSSSAFNDFPRRTGHQPDQGPTETQQTRYPFAKTAERMTIDGIGKVMVDGLPENRDDGRVQARIMMSAFRWSSLRDCIRNQTRDTPTTGGWSLLLSAPYSLISSTTVAVCSPSSGTGPGRMLYPSKSTGVLTARNGSPPSRGAISTNPG